MMKSQTLQQALQQSQAPNPRLLAQLLSDLDWNGEDIQLRNALSGSPAGMDETDFLNTLTNLGYRWKVHRNEIPGGYQKEGRPLLIRGEGRVKGLTVVKSRKELEEAISRLSHCLIYDFYFEPERAAEKRGWYQVLVLRFRRKIFELYVISLLVSLLALVMPFYIRAVYNIEIPGQQASSLFLLLPVAMGAVAGQLWLTQYRQEQLARIGAQLDLVLKAEVLSRLLRQRMPELERTSPLALASRLRSYQALRSYTTGPLALAALDLPFIVIFLAAIASMSVPLMGLTVVMVLICFGGVYIVGSVGRSLQASLSRNPSNLEGLSLELVQNIKKIKISGAERSWQTRLEVASANQALQGVSESRLQQIISILTGEFSQLTGALVLATGTGLALAGDGIELGTLIAAMFFVWRIFRPIQTGYQALSRWSVMRPTLEQLNAFMGPRDIEPDSAITQHWILPEPKGQIELKNVTLRLNAVQDPALLQVSCKISKGELVVIAGSEGSGSSSLLKLLDAQILPSSGVIRIDDADIRQYPLSQLRQSVSYLPEIATVFPGTLRENLLLANPLLKDHDLIELLKSLALDDLAEVNCLNRAVELQGPDALPPHQIQGVALARILLRRSPILLLDQPFSALSLNSSSALVQWLQKQKGISTMLVASDRPGLLQVADRILVLRDGAIAFDGTPTELLTKQQQTAKSPPTLAN